MRHIEIYRLRFAIVRRGRSGPAVAVVSRRTSLSTRTYLSGARLFNSADPSHDHQIGILRRNRMRVKKPPIRRAKTLRAEKSHTSIDKKRRNIAGQTAARKPCAYLF